MSGPYETERDARQSPAVRAIYAAFGADPGPGKMAPLNLAMLADACVDAGIGDELGAYDVRILEWLGGFEPETCAVVAGLITRAAQRRDGLEHDAGLRAMNEAVEAAVRAYFGELGIMPSGADAPTPEEAVKAAVAGLAEPHQDTLRQAFADAIAYRMARYAESATCPECVGYPQPCGEHQDHRDGASLYERLAAEFGIDPDAEPGDDL